MYIIRCLSMCGWERRLLMSKHPTATGKTSSTIIPGGKYSSKADHEIDTGQRNKLNITRTAPVKPRSIISSNRKLTLDDAYKVWVETPNEDNLAQVVNAARPVIDSAISSFVGSTNPVLKSKGRQVVAKSLHKYNPNIAQLNTYLMGQLQQLRRLAATQATAIYLPERQRQAVTHVYNARRKLEASLGREPSMKELADVTGLSTKALNTAMSRQGTAQITESQFTEAGSVLPVDAVEDSDEDTILEFVRIELDDTNRAILDMHKEGFSKADIARKLKLNPAAISRRAAQIGDKLRIMTEQYSEFRK